MRRARRQFRATRLRAISCAAIFGVVLGGARSEEPRGPTPEQRFFDWTRLRFSPQQYETRRDGLVAALRAAGGGVFLTPSRVGRSGGGTFRQLDDFLYFTGLELPDSILAIDADAKHAVLFTPRRDARFESAARPNDFPGRPLGADPAMAKVSGIDDIRPAETLKNAIKTWTESGRVIWIDTGRRGDVKPRAAGPFPSPNAVDVLISYLHVLHSDLELENAFEHVARLRMIKSPEEIAVIRRACTITVGAIVHAAGHVRDGVDERMLEGELEAAFKRGGAPRVAFDSIIKSGPNSLWPWRILASHYERRNRTMHDGELVIFDVGCELNHYASDMGRTFPISGRFTREQRDILEMVTAVADTMIAAIRPGVTLADVQAAGVAAIPADHRKYMQTGHYFGHHIGLSVGDSSLDDAVLRPGMVFTVEPWYYNHDKDIAVFIEDDVLVTSTGVENLTKDLPRTPDALERMTGN